MDDAMSTDPVDPDAAGLRPGVRVLAAGLVGALAGPRTSRVGSAAGMLVAGVLSAVFPSAPPEVRRRLR